MQYQSSIFFSILECPYLALIGDGYCNDKSNNEECNYDGGDCCLSTVNTSHCSKCTCFGQEMCDAGIIPSSIGDGFCNDETNNKECNYDGGDCCSSTVNSDKCSNCTCYWEETCAAGIFPSSVGDGYCNDESNNEECNYDGGDCCGSCIVTNLCSECSCLGNVTGNGDTSRSIGDGICNDETNTLECNFDGNDCCRNQTITDFCVNCTCIDGELIS